MSEKSVNHIGFIASQSSICQWYDSVAAIDEIGEKVKEICFSLEDVRRSPLAKEPARLADLKVRIKDLKEAVTYFERLTT